MFHAFMLNKHLYKLLSEKIVEIKKLISKDRQSTDITVKFQELIDVMKSKINQALINPVTKIAIENIQKAIILMHDFLEKRLKSSKINMSEKKVLDSVIKMLKENFTYTEVTNHQDNKKLFSVHEVGKTLFEEFATLFLDRLKNKNNIYIIEYVMDAIPVE
ncbi:hypothetical protein EDEG_03497 [Edhazardia aedis USNM 41457]|uniref:Uncharacterized protein n=1 Tax=Edhazardia aedis (strain USNM 41457) TaxID=1003232 RepID=J9DL22_EDHAE|nr:hypothetical protein EDEG_03497 [Edhazardia aedis USNM 41457]|eukprot:EJW02047.1 hypothetical protein EDEG_03497 [Edhazardia aedis USNM 41457]